MFWGLYVGPLVSGLRDPPINSKGCSLGLRGSILVAKSLLMEGSMCVWGAWAPEFGLV